MRLSARQRWGLAGALGVGAFLRLAEADLSLWYFDQVRDVSAAWGIAGGTAFPQLGPAVYVDYGAMGPLYYYVLSLPYLVSRAPAAGILFVAALNVIALGLCYRFTARWFGRREALVATALFAVFPAAVADARMVWNPALLPLGVLLFLHALFRWTLERHAPSFLGVVVWAGVLLQVHLSAVAFVVIAVLAWLRWRPPITPRAAGLGAAVNVLLVWPYLSYEWSHRAENVGALGRLLAAHVSVPGAAHVWHSLRFALPPGPRMLVAAVDDGPLRWLLAGSAAWQSVAGLLFGVGLGLCLLSLRRLAPGAGPVRLLLLWVAVPLALASGVTGGIWWFYANVLYPSQFIVIALLVLRRVPAARRPRRFPRRLAPIGVALLAGLAAWESATWVRWWQWVDRRGEIPIETARLWTGSQEPPLRVQVLVPLRHIDTLARILVGEFGLDDRTFAGRLHWSFDLASKEAELYRPSVRYAMGRGAARAAGPADPDTHVLVVKPAPTPAVHVLRVVRAGPYDVIAHRPLLEPDSVRYALRPGSTPAAAGRWVAEGMPTGRSLRVPISQGLIFWVEGRLQAAVRSGPVGMTVRLAGTVPLSLPHLEVNGRPVAAARVQIAPSGWDWRTEVLYDLRPALVKGENRVRLAISSEAAGYIHGMDIHEDTAAFEIGSGA